MSEWIADIWVEGIPKTQGSMRSVGPGRMVHPPALIAWRKTIFKAVNAWCDQYGDNWEPLTGPVDLDVWFYLPKAKSNRDVWPIGPRSGDTDKYVRGAGDAISLGETKLIADDSQVVRIRAEKRWAHGMPGEDGHEPGMRLRVRPHE